MGVQGRTLGLLSDKADSVVSTSVSLGSLLVSACAICILGTAGYAQEWPHMASISQVLMLHGHYQHAANLQ